MAKEELAAKLKGREYPFEMNVGEITEAKKAGLVILYGASDMNEVNATINAKE